MQTVIQAEEKSPRVHRAKPRTEPQRARVIEMPARCAEVELVIQAGALSDALIDAVIEEAIVPAYVETSASKCAPAESSMRPASLTAEL